MVEVAELAAQDTLKLPADIAARFRPADRFVIWVEGDTLYLKRINPISVTRVVAEAPEGEPLPMEQINEIVHQVRQRRPKGRRRLFHSSRFTSSRFTLAPPEA